MGGIFWSGFGGFVAYTIAVKSCDARLRGMVTHVRHMAPTDM